MTRGSLELKGLDKIIAGLQERRDLKPVRKVVKYHAADMHRQAMRNAPVDTGSLKRNIKLTIEDKGYTGRVRSNASYAAYQEYGTRFQTGTPHIRPAYYNVLWNFHEDLERLMK